MKRQIEVKEELLQAIDLVMAMFHHPGTWDPDERFRWTHILLWKHIRTAVGSLWEKQLCGLSDEARDELAQDGLGFHVLKSFVEIQEMGDQWKKDDEEEGEQNADEEEGEQNAD